jgi:hypothetical protein
MQQAQDTFVAEIDGIPLRVAKGEVLSDSHPLVKLDQAGAGVLFRPLDLEDGPAPKAKAAKPSPAAAGGKS